MVNRKSKFELPTGPPAPIIPVKWAYIYMCRSSRGMRIFEKRIRESVLTFRERESVSIRTAGAVLGRKFEGGLNMEISIL